MTFDNANVDDIYWHEKFHNLLSERNTVAKEGLIYTLLESWRMNSYMGEVPQPGW